MLNYLTKKKEKGKKEKESHRINGRIAVVKVYEKCLSGGVSKYQR
jgi:hypothetical protein